MNTELEMSNYFEEKGGSWDESGLVESLDRKGFTPNKCCSELIANSNDAQCTKVIWKIDSNHIKLIDDGIGMNRNKLQDMFKMFKSNNGERKTMGVSGLGGKEGSYILSKKKNKEPTSVVVYSHSQDDEYLKATIPWKEIFDEKTYTGKITFTSMLREEIVSFDNDLKDCKFKHGTSIWFKYNDELKNLIEMQFYKNKICNSLLPPSSRWDMIFGHAIPEIILEKTDGSPSLHIEKYNYFSGNDTDFYAGKHYDIIEQYVDDKNEDRYILISEDKTKEISHYGKNSFKTEPSDVRIHQTWKNEGTFEIYNGLRVDKRIFDPENPKELKEFLSAATFLNSYDSQYFTPSADSEFMKDSLSGCPVYRNSQMITKIHFDDKTYNAKTSRGSGVSMLNKFHHRTEIRYTTYSKQNNRMDISMGIQENKNQHQNIIPKPLERLITYLKSESLKKIHNHFNSVIKTKLEQKKLEAQQKKLAAQQKKFEEDQKKVEEDEKKVAAQQKKIEAKKPFIILSEDSDNNSVYNIIPQSNFNTSNNEKEEEEPAQQHEDKNVEENEHQNVTEEIVTNLVVTHEENSITNMSEPIQLKPINIQTIVEMLHAKYSDDNEKLIKIYDFINSL